MHPTFRETPHQKSVYVAEKYFTALCLFTYTWYVIKDPFNLSAREIGIGHQTGAITNSLSKPFAFKASQIGTVKRLCQTMALNTGFPVAFSQTIAVSR